MFFKVGVLKNSANFTGKDLYWNLFLIKWQPEGLQTLFKKTPTQAFSCEICEIFKDSIYLQSVSGGCFYVLNFWSQLVFKGRLFAVLIDRQYDIRHFIF